MRALLLLLLLLVGTASSQPVNIISNPTSGSSGGPPTGAAGGSLSGTYPNPNLANTVTNASGALTISPVADLVLDAAGSGGSGNVSLGATDLFKTNSMTSISGLLTIASAGNITLNASGSGTVTVDNSDTLAVAQILHNGGTILVNAGSLLQVTSSGTILLNAATSVGGLSAVPILFDTLRAVTTNSDLTIGPNGTGDEVIITAGDFLQLAGGTASPPNVGGIGYDTDDLAHAFNNPIGVLGNVGLFSSNTADSNTVSNNTSAVAFTGTGIAVPFPANSLSVGKVIRITQSGITTVSSNGAQGVFPITRIAGATAINYGLGIAQLGGQVDLGWRVQTDYIVRSIGVSGTIQPSGFCTIGLTDNPSAAAPNQGRVLAATLTAPLSINTTISNVFDMTWHFAVDTGGTESAVMKNCTVEILK